MSVNAKIISEEGEWGREVEEGNSSMIYLIYCMNLCKCYNVHTPSTKIKKINKT
jgi:hypothetical protein